MRAFFRQAFPSFYPSMHAVGQCSIAGASVFCVLFVLQPFGMNNYTTMNRLIVAAGYGIITIFVSVLFTCLLPVVFPRIFAESKWTVAREFVFFIVVTLFIAVANLFFSHFVDGAIISVPSLLRSMAVTFSVAFIPVFLAVFLKQQQLFKKYKYESEELNKILEGQIKPGNPETTTEAMPETTAGRLPEEDKGPENLLELTGSNQQEVIRLMHHQVLLVSAADNYVKVQYINNNQVKQVVLRGALKNFQYQLSQFDHLLRCHRSYIVNLSKVTVVSGNAQGYKLHISGLEEPVPVGRNYNSIVKEKLSHLRG